jgi:adenylyl- and sulfurtransferase ThiI
MGIAQDFKSEYVKRGCNVAFFLIKSSKQKSRTIKTRVQDRKKCTRDDDIYFSNIVFISLITSIVFTAGD